VSETDEIFVRLLDEGVEVWRPVLAQQSGPDRYRILDQPYDRELERWEFAPHDEVICSPTAADGGEILAAVSRWDPDSQ
jgi:hypothetical protein